MATADTDALSERLVAGTTGIISGGVTAVRPLAVRVSTSHETLPKETQVTLLAIQATVSKNNASAPAGAPVQQALMVMVVQLMVRRIVQFAEERPASTISSTAEQQVLRFAGGKSALV